MKAVNRIQVSASAFARAATCVSTEETRYYLRGVFVTPCEVDTGVLLVSTDGHRLLVIRDPNGVINGPPAIVSLDKVTLKALSTPGKEKAPRTLVVQVDEQNAIAAVCYGGEGVSEINPLDNPMDGGIVAVQTRGVIIDGSFPDWRRIIPQGSAEPVGGDRFNAGYLKDFGQALNLGLKSEHSSVRVVSSEVGNPALVFGNDPEAFGVIMPIRHASYVPANAPGWYNAKQQQSVAA